MTLELNFPYDVMIGSIIGITILGIFFMITRAIIKVNQNKTQVLPRKDEW